MDQFYLIIITLILSIVFIVFASAKLKINAFFVLLIASLLVGLVTGLPPEKIISAIKQGVGHTIEAIGVIIILGTTLGVILDKTGATLGMANFILSKVGNRHAPAAISATGFIIGLPIFCDSGFVVLSGLNNALSKKTNNSNVVMAVCLATGLYSVHCLIPPHPGAAAAAGIIGVDIGHLMVTGIFIAIPCAVTGFVWAKMMGKKYSEVLSQDTIVESIPAENSESVTFPSPLKCFLPIFIPILLISLKSCLFLVTDAKDSGIVKVISFIGDPVISLLIGILFSLFLLPKGNKKVMNDLLNDAIEKAGPILAIIAAGGGFGAILKAIEIGKYLQMALVDFNLGLFLPFLIAVILKTALGSSTVAIITTASIISPMLPGLHLDSDWGRLLTVLSMGAGSMMISHANDAYFWVISKFSNLSTEVTLRVYSTATVAMGIVTMACVFILSIFVLQ